MSLRSTSTTRSRTIPLVLVLAATLTLVAFAPPTLTDRIDQILRGEQANTAFWGIYVVDVNTGEVLYQQNADKALMPASNQKLITTATALDALGPDYRYQTTLFFDGTATDSTLQGDLILEGSGDPTFGSREIQGEDPLKAWAQSLADMGVRRIEGRIIGDDDIFDDRPYAEGWDVSFVAKESFAPASGGLSYWDNMATVKLHAQRAGEAPEITTAPEDYVQVRNRVETHSRRRGQRLRIDRSLGTNQVSLSGSLPRGYRGRFELPVANPTDFTLHAFETYLERAGIEVAAELVDVDDLETSLSYEDAEPLLVHYSPPLSEILAIINKESNNFYAEQVFRTFSWGGTTEGGGKRVEAFMERIGINPDHLSIADGSGLSRKDMVTPEALGQLLAHMHGAKHAATYRQSLPRGGEAETTLRYRLKSTPIEAKTGSLQFVRALSGYAETSDQRPVAFVILANNYTAPSYTITRTIDNIVRSLTTGS